MRQEMKDRIVYEVIVTAIGTAMCLGIWYLIEMPEWKRKELFTRAKSYRARAKNDTFTREIQKFQAQMAAWEHEMMRKKNNGPSMGPRADG